MPLENHDDHPRRRKRQHEGIAGEATLSSMLPKGWTLVSIIILGTAYAVWGWFSIEANAQDVVDLKAIHKEQTPKFQKMETRQGVMDEKLNGIEREQKRANRQRETDSANTMRLLESIDRRLNK